MQRIVAIRSASQAQAAEPRVNPEVGCCRKAICCAWRRAWASARCCTTGRLDAAWRRQAAPQEHHLPRRARKPAGRSASSPNCGITQRRGASNLVSAITALEPARHADGRADGFSVESRQAEPSIHREITPMKTLLLNKQDVGGLISMKEVIGTVEEAYKAFNSGQVIQPPIHASTSHHPGAKSTSSWVTARPTRSSR